VGILLRATRLAGGLYGRWLVAWQEHGARFRLLAVAVWVGEVAETQSHRGQISWVLWRPVHTGLTAETNKSGRRIEPSGPLTGPEAACPPTERHREGNWAGATRQGVVDPPAENR